MTREQFVEGYMARSGLLPYTLDGEVVTYAMDSGKPWVQVALECSCGEDGCKGWAMIPWASQNWHRFQNGLTEMTGEEAMQADIEMHRAA